MYLSTDFVLKATHRSKTGQGYPKGTSRQAEITWRKLGRLEIVHQFAEALDRNDYGTALRLLEPDANYQRGRDLIRGAPAIVDSFRNVSEWGDRNLDELKYSHDIDDEGSPFEISFVDVLRSDGDVLEIRHSVYLELSKNGLIESLRFVQPPGEKEILDEFLRRHHLEPPGRKR